MEQPMPEFSKRFEFGNYTLNFGDQKVLLDLLEEIVAPSFHEMKHIRTIKNRGQYFFIDTEIVNLGEEKEGPILGIAGRGDFQGSCRVSVSRCL
jgi:hypothetical protein